jgi:membrane fusion protein, multidrug efflux system
MLPMALEVVQVVSKQLEATLRLPAELAPEESVAIYARVNAFIEEITVDRGSKIKQGQLLVRLSAPELNAQRAEAQAKLGAARSTYDRLKEASATPGAVAGHDLEIAEATLAAEKSRVQSLGALEGYLAIRAPWDGVVTERAEHPGALVGPPVSPNATPILRIEKIDRLRLTVGVPEADVGAIQEGGKAAFTVSTWPGDKFEGKIVRLSHVIDAKTRTMSVELDVDNKGAKQLTPGAYAEVLWPVRREQPSLFVPASAVVQTTEKTYVDRVRDGAVEQIPVQRGVATGDLVEVFGALAAGDQVLKRGSETLQAGAKVTTKPAAPAGSAAPK